MQDRTKLPTQVRHDVAAICIADLHFMEHRPIGRAETDWFAVQEAVLDEIAGLQNKYYCPILVAGDVFNIWNASAWIVNWVLIHMPPDVYAIPGNHDLPFHSYRDAPKSSYWTLVEAGKIKNLTPGGSHTVETRCGTSLLVTPFPCGFDVTPCKDKSSLCLKMALVHDCIWTEKTGFPTADPNRRYAKWLGKLTGYDIAVFGDNHHGFLIQNQDKVSILNCGSILRRKSDEKHYTPSIGLIHAKGNITRHFLNIEKDQFTDLGKDIVEIEAALSVDLTAFVEELMRARGAGLNWKGTVVSWCKKNNLDEDVKAIIIRAVESVK